jgi:hypothetical protein
MRRMSFSRFNNGSDSEQGEKMETSHNGLVVILALQVICIIGMGYRICFLAKRDLVLAKAKVSTQPLARVGQSPRQ